MAVWIGTSGYSYVDWVGPFYPPGTRPGGMLPFYCHHFPLVELNFTFYRPPGPDTLVRLAEKSPAAFQFVVKLPRTLSHEERPDDLPAFRLAVEGLRDRDQLLGLLCQLPQAAHYTRKTLAWLDRLAAELGDLRLAVEFRHASWCRPAVNDWLAERQLDLVSVDAPDLPRLYPSGLVQTTPRIYVRFHSRNAGNWYASDKERYDYHYTDAELTDWIEQIRDAAPTGDVLLLFNNCMHSQAIENARRIGELLRRLAPELAVVPPPIPPDDTPRQRTLFDDLI